MMVPAGHPRCPLPRRAGRTGKVALAAAEEQLIVMGMRPVAALSLTPSLQP
jgi:hypothetical protein